MMDELFRGLELPLWNVILALIYTYMTLLGAYYLRRLMRANPVFWFLLFQWIMAVGTIVAVDLDRYSDQVYVGLYFVALPGFLVGAILSYHILDVNRTAQVFWNKPIERERSMTKLMITLVVLLAAIITVIYYRAVGYNIFQQLALGYYIEDIVSERLASYSGEDYFAPGYVNQFKNIILPLGLVTICIWVWQAGNRLLGFSIIAFSAPFLLYALMGTGQRAPLVYVFLSIMFGVSLLVRLRLKFLAMSGFSVLLVFGWLSFYLGRVSELSLLSSINSALTRVFVNEQEEGIVGFRFIFSKETAWFSEWGQGFLGILPWHRGSELAHQVYEVLHGTPRGTSTITAVGSVAYNGSVWSVPFAYFFLGIAYTAIYWRLLSGKRKVLRCLLYGAIFFFLATYVSGPPVGLVNKGVIALLIMLLIQKLSFTSRSREIVTPPVVS